MVIRELLDRGGVLVLSGAGVSTESGIPDYRGPTSVQRTPMTYQAFVGSASARRRYWARSHLGWEVIGSAQPNRGHAAVAALQAKGQLHAIITQNVDGLHQAAGARDVLELHGALSSVICLSCDQRCTRSEHATRLREANPGFSPDARALPDGDVDLSDVEHFRVVDCFCGGLLKPDVVFFGENVPAYKVEQAFAWTESARSVLVLGSSLTVRSGYRFVLRAAKLGIPVAIINQGPTRADELATIKVDAPLGETLTALLQDRMSA